MSKRKLHIDFETRCQLNVAGKTGVGVHKYVRHPSFKIIIFAYAYDDEEPTALDLYYEEYPGANVPVQLIADLTNPNVEKWSHNAPFEIQSIEAYFGIKLDLSQWRCTLIASAYLGLPLALDKVSKALGLSEAKDAKGKALITWFCIPIKGTDDEYRDPKDYPAKWAMFLDYGKQDVRVERAIEKFTLRFSPLPDFEFNYWLQDQVINNNGITLDLDFINAAQGLNNGTTAEIHRQIVALTGVDNPKSLQQLKAWISEQMGDGSITSLARDYLEDEVNVDLLPAQVAKLIGLYQLANKTSSSKYNRMLEMVCDDGRIYGLIQFYGANRTGRAAGRGVQPQNLKLTFSNEKIREQAPHLIGDGLEVAKAAIIKGVAPLLYDDVPNLISMLVRTCFVAAPGKMLVVSDFAQIEARVLPWLAGEEWALDTFRRDEDIYIAAASKMFNVAIDPKDKKHPLRKKGKVATLALGYQGWTGALINLGALREGLTEDELAPLAKGWRNVNPKIVKFWKTLEVTARHVISKRTKYTIKLPYCELVMRYDRKTFFITLPSGRSLAYHDASVARDGTIRYWGIKQKAPRSSIWAMQDTYGGSLAENITQAIARDCLYFAMYNMRKYSPDLFDILLHIHDEIVAEAWRKDAKLALDTMNDVMSVGPPWAKGLPLKGDGYISPYYKKD